LLAHPDPQISDERRAELLADDLASFGTLSVVVRSILNSASIRRTASSASGEMTAGVLP
jgi:hypothetical protein